MISCRAWTLVERRWPLENNELAELRQEIASNEARVSREALRQAAIVAGHNGGQCSTAYDIARDLWRQWWQTSPS